MTSYPASTLKLCIMRCLVSLLMIMVINGQKAIVNEIMDKKPFLFLWVRFGSSEGRQKNTPHKTG